MMMKNHIFITGMHRSGTSFLARALSLSGLYLGPTSDFYDTEINPKPGNLKGHWENNKINLLNEQILRINGSTWDDIAKEITKIPKNFKNDVDELLKSFYDHKTIAYGFKDPRFSLTLDLWIPLFSKSIIIGIFRHPLKVAESLNIRNGLSYDESLDLWKKYNEHLLFYLEKYGGLLLDFDWPHDKLVEETKLVATKIGLPSIDIDQWLSDELKRSDRSFDNTYPVPNSIMEIYAKLQDFATKNRKTEFTLPTITENDYKLIIRDMIITSNQTYLQTLEVTKNELAKITNNVMKNQTLENNPMGILLSLFYSREDLQISYPEVLQGKYDELVDWAIRICTSDIKNERLTKNILSKFLQWYDNYKKNKDFIRTLESTFGQNHTELIQCIQKNTSLLENEVSQYRQKTTSLENEVSQYRQKTTSLENEVSQYHGELNMIKSGLGFKITRFCGSKIDALFGRKTIFHDIKRNVVISKEVIKNEGFNSFLNHAEEKIKKREFTIAGPTLYDLTTKESQKIEPEKIMQTTSHLFAVENKQVINYEPKFKTSVIVHTDNTHLSSITSTINSQVGLDLEIIPMIVNNFGSEFDRNERKKTLSNKSDVKNIKPNDDYVICIYGNLLPLTNHLFYDMCNILMENPKMAIVICNEIPGSDSDLSYSYFVNKQHTVSQSSDQIVFDKNFIELDNPDKVQLIKINSSCMCYRKTILSKYGLSNNTRLDPKAVLQLLNDGYMILKLFSTGVIQNPPKNFNYLQSGFEHEINSILFTQKMVDFKKMGVSKLDELSDHIFTVYSSLCNTIILLEKTTIKDTSTAFNFVYKNILIRSDGSNIADYSKSIVKLLDSIHKTGKQIDSDSYVLNQYLESLKTFEHYVLETFPNLQGIEDDFVKALCNIFEETVGKILGEYAIYAKKNNTENLDLFITEQISSVSI